MRLADARLDEAVGAHDGQLGEVVDGVAVLDLDDDGGHVADDLVEPGLLAALVDPGQVLVEEIGVLLVPHGGVRSEIHHVLLLALNCRWTWREPSPAQPLNGALLGLNLNVSAEASAQ